MFNIQIPLSWSETQAFALYFALGSPIVTGPKSYVYWIAVSVS